MVYAFARVSAVLSMRVEDYFQAGKRWRIRLHEKGGVYNEVKAHHKLEAFLDAYLEAAGIENDKRGCSSEASTEGESSQSAPCTETMCFGW